MPQPVQARVLNSRIHREREICNPSSDFGSGNRRISVIFNTSCESKYWALGSATGTDSENEVQNN